MAFALVNVCEISANGDDVRMRLDIIFSGPDMPTGPSTHVTETTFSGGTTLAALKAQVSALVTSEALNEFGVTVTGNNMILPSFQKG